MITEVESVINITIPDEIVKLLSLKTGDYLDAKIEDGRIILTPIVFFPRSEVEQTEIASLKENTGDKENVTGETDA